MPFRTPLPRLTICALALVAATKVQAGHFLGQLTRLENEAYVSLEYRSDLWSSTGRNKPSPLRIYDIDLNIPVVDQSRWRAAVLSDVDGLGIGRSDLVVGRHQVLVGSDLRSQQYGFGVTREFEDLASTSLFAAYASASDEPFQNGRDTWVETTAVYRTAPTEFHQWVFGMNYSKNRGYLNNLPMAVFGYIYKPYPGFQAIIGFPHLQFIWEKKGTGLAAIRLNPTLVEGELRRVLSDYTVGGLRAGLNARSYLHIHRVEDDYRLYYQEEFIRLGFETRLSVNTSIRPVIGYSFDRSMYESKQIFQRIGPETRLPSDAFGEIRWEYRL